MEAKGQEIDDPQSPYDGQTIPNLNNGRFIRGSSESGQIGGSGSVRLRSSKLLAHNDGPQIALGGFQVVPNNRLTPLIPIEIESGRRIIREQQRTVGSGVPPDITPLFYTTVMIIRVK